MGQQQSCGLKDNEYITQGFTLFEALISLFIVSLSLLGLLSLEARATRYSYHAFLDNEASILMINAQQELMMTEHPNETLWNQCNHLYLPNSNIEMRKNRLTLTWQNYENNESISLIVQ